MNVRALKVPLSLLFLFGSTLMVYFVSDSKMTNTNLNPTSVLRYSADFSESRSSQLQQSFNQQSTVQLTWKNLLPAAELEVLDRFQTQNVTTTELSDQILRSIEAAANKDYQAALSSMNTVSEFNKRMVSIPGYIVPIEFHPDNTVSLAFIVIGRAHV